MDSKSLFREHLKIITSNATKALEACGFDYLAIDAGSAMVHFADDMHVPFKATPHFTHWCPVADESHIIFFRPGEKPQLFHVAPYDYWHEHKPLETSFWTDEFSITSTPTSEAGWAQISTHRKVAYIGPHSKDAMEAGAIPNPSNLTAYLDWFRAYKSAYEIDCISTANKKATPGHRKARELFLAGASELEIHLGYLAAVGFEESALPYRTIICLDERGAILHYHDKRLVGNGKSFLIDAGAQHHGYASDISRTWFSENAHPVFKRLVAGLNKSQMAIAASLKPDEPYLNYHAKAEHDIGDLLLETGILRGNTTEHAVEKRLVQPFFPHGVGHMLGIQVHDVGGHQIDVSGATSERDLKYPNLRTHRTMEAGMVVTIEPGIYFIPMLLDKFRYSEHSGAFNWELIAELMPMGGIRIEDDVLVTNTGGRNLTREHLPE